MTMETEMLKVAVMRRGAAYRGSDNVHKELSHSLSLVHERVVRCLEQNLRAALIRFSRCEFAYSEVDFG